MENSIYIVDNKRAYCYYISKLHRISALINKNYGEIRQMEIANPSEEIINEIIKEGYNEIRNWTFLRKGYRVRRNFIFS